MISDDYKQMPEDWYPEHAIVVVAKDSGNELGFAITKEAYQKGYWKEQIEPSLRGLRLALWQAQFCSEEDLKKRGLK